MHIGMVHFSERGYPPDVRIHKEVQALSSQHKVTILTELVKENERPLEELGTNYCVYRVPINVPSLLSRILEKFTLQKVWLRQAIIQFINDQNPDVLHVHDFHILPTVLPLALQYELPIVADLHENMPAAQVVYRVADPLLKRALRAFFNPYWLWRHYEKTTLPQCDRVIVVVPQAAERLLADGLAKDKIVVISNREDETTFTSDLARCDKEILSKYEDKWMITYVGGLGPHRGVDTVVRALPLLNGKIPNLLMTVVGAVGKQAESLQGLAKQLGVSDLLEVIPWQPFEKVQSFVHAAKVCLVPHENFEHTQTTVPHKLFQYMMCARPVLVSNCRPLAEVIEEAKAGAIFQAGNERDCAEKLLAMHNNPKEQEAAGKRGQEAVLGPMAWRHEAKRLCEMYQSLAAELGKTSQHL